MMQDDGLRSWLQQADALGELRTIAGADWDLEIGGVADIVTERGSSTAVLFDSIKNYPKGYRVLINSLGSTKRLGLSLRMPQNLSALGFISEWRKKSKTLKYVPPTVVREGPVLENIRRGKDVDLWRFRPRVGSSKTAADTSAPAALISPTIPKKAGLTWVRRSS